MLSKDADFNKEQPSNLDVDWIEIIDLLASEYGWTIPEIKELDLSQVSALLSQIRKRYKKQNESINEQQEQSPSSQEIPTSDFVTKMGGKLTTDEDGTKRIVV